MPLLQKFSGAGTHHLSNVFAYAPGKKFSKGRLCWVYRQCEELRKGPSLITQTEQEDDLSSHRPNFEALQHRQTRRSMQAYPQSEHGIRARQTFRSAPARSTVKNSADRVKSDERSTPDTRYACASRISLCARSGRSGRGSLHVETVFDRVGRVAC